VSGQTLTSRGKGPEFWGLYVEEWDVPLSVDLGDKKKQGWALATGQLGLFVIKQGQVLLCHFVLVDEHDGFYCAVLFTMFTFCPIVPIFITAWFKAPSA
jgi:hypothetical protein